jgi:cytochrome P450
LQELHRKYGSVVRVSSDEVSFVDEKAWAAFYASRQGTCLPKSPHWFVPRRRPNDIAEVESTGIMASTKADHGRFRRAFAPSFTTAALRRHEPMIQSHVEILVSQLYKEALKNARVNISRWFEYLTFDIIGDLGYSKSFHTLENEEHRQHVDVVGSFLTPMTREASLRSLGLPIFRQLTVAKRVLHRQISYSISLGRWINERLSEGNGPDKPDLMTYFSKASDEKGLSIIETENAVRDFMIAGTETVTESLTAICYYLVRDQGVLRSLTGEIREAFVADGKVSTGAIATLPFLNAVINEAMRLAPSIPTVLPRIVTAPGIDACGYWLPAGVYPLHPWGDEFFANLWQTFITFCQFAAYRSPTNFYSPDEFIPARWLPNSKIEPHNVGIFHPFSIGPRDCIGKVFALTELRLLVANLLWNFDLTRGEADWDWNSQGAYFAWEKRPLFVRLSPKIKS